MDELGDVELRAMLEEATVEALELADELASLVAQGDGLRPDASRVSANYMQARALVRSLRRALATEVGC